MKLNILGEIAAIISHRAGVLVTLRYQAGLADGAPVFTEHIGGLLRGVSCDGPDRGGETLPPTPERPAADKPPLWSVPIAIDPLASYIYDGCADLKFPIHTSPQFAKSVGLPGIIYQGTATLAHACRLLLERQAGGDPTRLLTLSCRFGAIIQPGETIEARLSNQRSHAQSAAHTECFFAVENQSGHMALRDGYALLKEATP
jgi:acyl dehydratase